MVGQVQLPIRLGGFGLPSMAGTHDAAFFGCMAEVLHDTATRHDGSACWLALDGAAGLTLPSSWVAHAQQAGDRLRRRLAAGAPVAELQQDESQVVPLDSLLPSVDELMGKSRSRLQALITRQLGTHTHKLLVGKASTGLLSRHNMQLKQTAQRERARWWSIAGPGAAGWLTALPLSPALTLSSSEFKFACRLRLGAQQPGCRALERGMCACSKAAVDP